MQKALRAIKPNFGVQLVSLRDKTDREVGGKEVRMSVEMDEGDSLHR